jgi:flavorubredoxin
MIMGKILVIYHSQQFGDTKTLAEALAEGTRKGGAEVEMINTNERRVTLDEFLSADGIGPAPPTIILMSPARSRFFLTIFGSGTGQANL